MPGEWSSSTMVSESVPGVFLLILVAVFMEETKDDSELGPLCRELPFKKKKKVMLQRTVFLLGSPLLLFVFMMVLSTPSLLENRQKKAPVEEIRTNGFKQI